MSEPISIEHWPVRLESELASNCEILKRITVLREVDSTQDAARRLDARIGDVITTWRQTSGRGRLGRAWADTGDDGVAVTMVVERRAPEQLAVATAVGTAAAIESTLGRPVGIKWPNDILIQGRKIAGVLIEQIDQRAIIGIGINVSQKSWPSELADRAVSLRQLGVNTDRLDVMCALLERMDTALRASDQDLVAQFLKRDVLAGTTATFRTGEQIVAGCVTRVDPMSGLEVRAADGTNVFLPAATTTIIHAENLAAATSLRNLCYGR